MNRVLSVGGLLGALALGAAAPVSADVDCFPAGDPNASVSFSVQLLNTLDNSATTQIHWDGVTLPNGWVRSGAYIQLTSTITQCGSGLQIYTDNKAADANPRFVGVSSVTNPMGLVDVQNSSFTLPMAWSVKSFTQPVPGLDTDIPPTPTDPNGCATTVPHACEWNYFTDRSTVKGPPGVTDKFQDGAEFQTVVASDLYVDSCTAEGFPQNACYGAQFDQFTFFPSPATLYIYTEANFNTAVTPRIFKTSTLRLEAYTQ